jgi:hypothetical protein
MALETTPGTSRATSPGAAPASRKIRRLGIAVAIVVALYSAGWFLLASKFEDFLKSHLDGVGPIDIQCPGLATSGFPFLIGFTCDKTEIADGSTGNSLTAGAFRAAARIYSPGSAVVELDSPAHVSLSDGSSLAAEWKSMRSSFSVGFSQLKTLSAVGEDVSLNYLSDRLYEAIVIEASHGELHIRGNGGNLEAAILARDFQLGAEGAEPILPKLATSLQITFDGKAGLLEGRPVLAKPMKGQLTSFKIEMPDGLYGELSGPYEIDDAGYISGEFKTHLEKLALWEQHLLRLFPGGESTISGMAALLRGLAKDDKVTVNLVIDKGTITLSMVPIGHIPPF